MNIETSIALLFDDKLHQNKKTFRQKEIVRHVQSCVPTATKKDIKKALKTLTKSGKIAQVPGDKKVYRRIAAIERKVNDSPEAPEESNSSIDQDDNKKPLPIAEVLRRRKGAPTTIPKTAANSKKDSEKEEPTSNDDGDDDNVEDIDEEIRRLEAELNQDSESNDDEEDSITSSADHHHPEQQQEEGGVINLSSVAADRIAALPSTCLPTNKRRVLKIDKVDNDQSAAPKEPKSKKRLRKHNTNETQSESNILISEGLRAAVKGVLDGYVPRSNEKLPFYCRVCAKQYQNDEEFFQHKKSAFHQAAVEMEKKASYCKLCRKQLTSPVQLKEHLSSKPHKDRLQNMKRRQPSSRKR